MGRSWTFPRSEVCLFRLLCTIIRHIISVENCLEFSLVNFLSFFVTELVRDLVYAYTFFCRVIHREGEKRPKRRFSRRSYLDACSRMRVRVVETRSARRRRAITRDFFLNRFLFVVVVVLPREIERKNFNQKTWDLNKL